MFAAQTGAIFGTFWSSASPAKVSGSRTGARACSEPRLGGAPRARLPFLSYQPMKKKIQPVILSFVVYIWSKLFSPPPSIMCGIFAVHGLDKTSNYRAHFIALSKRLRHRGPDWSGCYEGQNSILVHERLAIVGVGQLPFKYALYMFISSLQIRAHNPWLASMAKLYSPSMVKSITTFLCAPALAPV
jgi:hypothetical protein